MTFSQALDCLKAGSFVARSGWNGKGMYLWVLNAATVQQSWIKDPILLSLCEEQGGTVECDPSIRMKLANGHVMTGWVPTQGDMFAEDWEIVPKVVE